MESWRWYFALCFIHWGYRLAPDGDEKMKLARMLLEFLETTKLEGEDG